MSGYLLDTDVLSLLSPGRVNVPEGFKVWVEAQELYIIGFRQRPNLGSQVRQRAIRI